MATTDCLYGSRQGHKYGTDGFFYRPSVSFYRELLQYSCAALQTQAAAAVDFGRK